MELPAELTAVEEALKFPTTTGDYKKRRARIVF
jgi:hypothetical protein